MTTRQAVSEFATEAKNRCDTTGSPALLRLEVETEPPSPASKKSSRKGYGRRLTLSTHSWTAMGICELSKLPVT